MKRNVSSVAMPACLSSLKMILLVWILHLVSHEALNILEPSLAAPPIWHVNSISTWDVT